MLHHQDVGYWGFKDLWVQVQIWWTWNCHSSRMLRILGSSRTAPDLVNLEITPHQDVGYWGFYGSLRYNSDLGSGPDTVNTKMSTPRMLDIEDLRILKDCYRFGDPKTSHLHLGYWGFKDLQGLFHILWTLKCLVGYWWFKVWSRCGKPENVIDFLLKVRLSQPS